MSEGKRIGQPWPSGEDEHGYAVGYDVLRCKRTGKLKASCLCPDCLAPDLSLRQSQDEEWAARRRAEREAELAEAAATVSGRGSVSSAAAAASEQWEEHWDPTHQRHYYHNEATGETTWERPAALPPAPAPSPAPAAKVAKKFGGGGESCAKCGKTVYFAERVAAQNMVFHAACFRCTTCAVKLGPSNWCVAIPAQFLRNSCAILRAIV